MKAKTRAKKKTPARTRPKATRPRLVRENGMLLVSVGRPINLDELKAALADYL